MCEIHVKILNFLLFFFKFDLNLTMRKFILLFIIIRSYFLIFKNYIFILKKGTVNMCLKVKKKINRKERG